MFWRKRNKAPQRTVSTCTNEEEGLEALRERYPEEDQRLLRAFLNYKGGKAKDAAAHYEDVRRWRKALGPVSVQDLEPHLRSGSYVMTLESSDPVHTPKQAYTHTPIIYMNGMPKGGRMELTRQVVYAVERAWATMPADLDPPKVKFVVNARGPAFRPPEPVFQNGLMQVLSDKYPWLMNCEVHFLDAPGFVRYPLSVAGKFFPRSYTEKFHLSRSKDVVAHDPDMKAVVDSELGDWDSSRAQLQLNIEQYLRRQSQYPPCNLR